MKSIDARGLIDVYFYKEVAAGLFQTSSKNDLGLGISKKDIVVLKNPQYVYRKDVKQYGYNFSKKIRDIVDSYM